MQPRRVWQRLARVVDDDDLVCAARHALAQKAAHGALQGAACNRWDDDRAKGHVISPGLRAKWYARWVATSKPSYGARSTTHSTSKSAACRFAFISSVVKKRKSKLTGCPHHSSMWRISVPMW